MQRLTLPLLWGFVCALFFRLLPAYAWDPFFLHPNDLFQHRVNEEAFRKRFEREPEPDELSGIQIAPAPHSPGYEFRNPNWKMILMTGDDSISAFDNARKKLFSLFSTFGVFESIQLSRAPKEQINGVRATSVANLEKAFQDLHVQEGDGCLLHITSHGSTSGFYIAGQNALTPSKLNQIVTDNCGSRPTVLLISACYSGIFAEPSMQAPHRIILTAARKDKTSFGCSAEEKYTYWDDCLIQTLLNSSKWMEVAEKIEKCIEKKESAGGFARSYPQARFGANMVETEIMP